MVLMIASSAIRQDLIAGKRAAHPWPTACFALSLQDLERWYDCSTELTIYCLGCPQVVGKSVDLAQDIYATSRIAGNQLQFVT